MPAKKATAKKTAAKKPATKAAAKPAKPAKQRSFDELLAPHPPDVQALAQRLREIIAAVMPEGDEHIYFGWAFYSAGHVDKFVCGIQPRGDYCLLYVHNVAAADHPELVLEGTGKHCHQLKVCLPEGITNPAAVERLLEDARKNTVKKR